MIDHDIHTSVSRVSPEAPVPVTLVESEEFKLGGSANVAVGIKKLDVDTEIIGVVGSDEYGDRIRHMLSEYGIDSHILTEDVPTIRKARIKSEGQQLLRVDYERSFEVQVTNNTIEKNLESATALIISDYAKGTVKNYQNIITSANKAGVKVFVDPKGTDFKRYRSAYLLKPNLKEFEAIVGPTSSDADMLYKARRLIADLCIEYLLVTCGADGMHLISSGGHLHVQHEPIEVFDVTGAGDTVIATLCVFLGEGFTIEKAVETASLAASLVVQKRGTSFVLRSEIEKHARAPAQVGSVDHAESSGQKIVFTNGCFDLLHVGHIRFLEEASKLGAKLIIGLNSDASVKKLKGNTRPIITAEDRKEILETIKFVSKVIIFDDETPEKLIKNLKPDVLVKGAEYTEKEIIGHDFVSSYGGKVVTIEMVPGKSTSNIHQKIMSVKNH